MVDVVYDKENHFKQINSEIKRHLEDSEVAKLSHWDAASWYEKINKYGFSIPSMIISLLISWLLSDGAKGTEVGSYLISMGAAVFLSLLASILSGVSAFLNFSELSIRHRSAAENLNALNRDCKNWATDFPDSSKCEEAMKKAQIYRSRISEINKDAPQIPRRSWKSVSRSRTEGSVSYKYDCDGVVDR